MWRSTYFLSSPPTFKNIQYRSNKNIILMLDVSLIKIRWIIGQDREDGNKYVIRFGTKVLNSRKRDYAQVK